VVADALGAIDQAFGAALVSQLALPHFGHRVFERESRHPLHQPTPQQQSALKNTLLILRKSKLW
jgi:hypothetical protein